MASQSKPKLNDTKKNMDELRTFIFRTQALHLYRSFLKAVRDAPTEAQGRDFYASIASIQADGRLP